MNIRELQDQIDLLNSKLAHSREKIGYLERLSYSVLLEKKHLEKELSSAKDRIRELEEMIEYHADHHPECDLLKGYPDSKCDCGLESGKKRLGL